MSNCVAFKSDLVLDSKDIDIDGFMFLVNRYKDMPKAPEDDFGSFSWWYLSGNIEEVIPGELIIIHLGESRSTHTFRDFRGMLAVCIAPLLKKDRKVTLIAQDRENAHEGWFKWEVNLSGEGL